MSIKTEFNFGEMILVTGYIRRSKTSREGREWYAYDLEAPESAIFLGAHNLSNGKVEWSNNGEDGYESYFSPTEYIKGAWICKKNRKPEKVFLSMCQKIKVINDPPI